MRTTLTLEADVAARLKAEVRRTGKALKAVVNDALKRGLGMGGLRAGAPRFKIKARPLGLKPGFDRDRLNQLVDELEVVETARKLRS